MRINASSTGITGILDFLTSPRSFKNSARSSELMTFFSLAQALIFETRSGFMSAESVSANSGVKRYNNTSLQTSMTFSRKSSTACPSSEILFKIEIEDSKFFETSELYISYYGKMLRIEEIFILNGILSRNLNFCVMIL